MSIASKRNFSFNRPRYQRKPMGNIVHSSLETLHVLPLGRQVFLRLHCDAYLVINHGARAEMRNPVLILYSLPEKPMNY